MKKRIFQAILSLACGFSLSFGGLTLLAYQIVDHFRPAKIYHELEEKRAATLPKCIDQPYYYLGKGSQSYVFVSEDGKYVLKFFRMNRYRGPKKEQKLQDLLTSCRIASQTLSQETALVYLHLEKSYNLKKKVLIHDALFRPYVIDLDETAFLIQKRATPIYAYLKELINNHQTEEVCKALADLKKILKSRFRKQIADHDPVIEKNAGFLNGRAIFIDTGQFYHNDRIDASIEGNKVMRKLKLWLEEQDPSNSELYLTVLNF